MRPIVIAAVTITVACAPVSNATRPAPVPLHPYSTATPSATAATPAGLVPFGETPLPSPTPSRYTIRAGDTLSQIAESFRISLDSLLAANPGLNPAALRVGEEIQVPGRPVDLAGVGTPTPVSFLIRQITCNPTLNGAVWCFVLVENNAPDNLENITAQVALLDSAGSLIDTKAAALPLDILPPASALPISVLFPPPVPLEFHAQVQILTGIRLLPGDRRYLPASVGDATTLISWSGRSAHVSGNVHLPTNSAAASSVWLVAVGYDSADNVVGWRRWESPNGVPAGGEIPFDLTVSSVAGRISRVEFVVQARP